MKISKSDYVLASTPDHRTPFMFKVSGTDNDLVRGVDSRFPHMRELRTLVEIPRSSVFLNLGATPRPGKLYGVDTNNLYHGYKDHEKFGPVHFFYKINPDVRKSLFKAFSILYKNLRKLGLQGLADEDVVYEIHGKEGGGSMTGMYYPSSPKVRSRLVFRPEKTSASDYVYVLAHELAHHLHFTYCNHPKVNSAWIKLYSTSIRQTPVGKDVATQLVHGLISTRERPSKYAKTVLESDDDKLAYTWILRCIQQTHGLSIRDLDQLSEAGEYDEIERIWPSKVVPKKELQPVITRYACKNFHETFAEAVSFYIVGKKLPKEVTDLVEHTLSYCKIQMKE